MQKSWWKLLGLIIVTQGVGFLSSLLAGDIRGKYEAMTKIPLAPPGNIFGIVWPLLYLLMAVSLYLILTRTFNKQQSGKAVMIYCAQLLLNFSWSIVFFGGDLLMLAIPIVLLLLGAVMHQIFYYRKLDRLAGNLLIPYVIWLVFAAYLNIGFAFVN